MSAIASFINCMTCGCLCNPSEEDVQQKQPLNRDLQTPVNGSSAGYLSYQRTQDGPALQHLQYQSRNQGVSPSSSLPKEHEDSSSEDEAHSPSRYEEKEPKTPFRTPPQSPQEKKSPFHSPGSGKLDTQRTVGWDSMVTHGSPPQE